MQAMRLSFAPLCAALLAAGNAAFAQQFSGQNITLIVNYSAGGPSDIEARIIAKHLPKYVQGLSSLVVRNVAGGGGRIAVNQLGESSQRDRLNISFFTWNPLDQIVQDSALRVRYNDLKLVTGLQQVSLLYVRRDAPPGIGKPSDIAKLQPFKAGGLGPTGHGVLRQRLALDLLGAKYETISGYKG
ncbi:MAG: hypothetical protein HYY28_03100, partial [Betaproteobacteria bacterium]|nr:hypothetical protein [Betaproteobacteria bacterium]